jgi:regulatory protein YycI of two-component signal transduction system YycFG
MEFDQTTYIYIGVAVVVLILIIIIILFSGKSKPEEIKREEIKREEIKREEIKNKQIIMSDLNGISNFDMKLAAQANSINNASGPKEMTAKSSNELTIENQK